MRDLKKTDCLLLNKRLHTSIERKECSYQIVYVSAINT